MLSLNVEWIVSCLIGVNGPHVLRLVEKDSRKEAGLKPKRLKMGEKNALVVTRRQKHAIKENVQVCRLI